MATMIDVYTLVKKLAESKGMEYLKIDPTKVEVGNATVVAEYLTPSWFSEEVIINMRTDKVSTKSMTKAQLGAFYDMLNDDAEYLTEKGVRMVLDLSGYAKAAVSNLILSIRNDAMYSEVSENNVIVAYFEDTEDCEYSLRKGCNKYFQGKRLQGATTTVVLNDYIPNYKAIWDLLNCKSRYNDENYDAKQYGKDKLGEDTCYTHIFVPYDYESNSTY